MEINTDIPQICLSLCEVENNERYGHVLLDEANTITSFEEKGVD